MCMGTNQDMETNQGMDNSNIASLSRVMGGGYAQRKLESEHISLKVSTVTNQGMEISTMKVSNDNDAWSTGMRDA